MKKRFSFLLVCLLSIFLTSCSLVESGDEEYGIDPSVPTTQVTTTYSDVYNNIYNSCFGVRNNRTSSSYMIGSAVCIKKDDTYSYFLTNRHVVEAEDLSKISSNVSIYFGNSYYVSGEVIASTSYAERVASNSGDLALIRIKTPASKTIVPAVLGNDIVTKGQNVLAVGCPQSLTYYNTLTVGVVEKVHESTNIVQHQATLNPGNSGGGLFNLAGRLIGINVSKYSTDDEYYENMNFAIDMAKIRSFLSQAKIEL